MDDTIRVFDESFVLRSTIFPSLPLIGGTGGSRTARVAITVATCELAYLKTTLKVRVESSPSMISGAPCVSSWWAPAEIRISPGSWRARDTIVSLMSSSVCARELIVSASVARRTLSRVGTRR